MQSQVKLLYVVYHYPPRGGSGVQRALKFTKYLAAFGVQPVVLTAELDGNGERELSVAMDHTLDSEVPNDIRVHRIKWVVGSESRDSKAVQRFIEAASAIVEAERPDVLLASMSPFTDTVLANTLSSRFKLPWIADLRDPWALDEFQVYPTAAHRLWAQRQMGRQLRSAGMIIMNTPEAAELYKRRFHPPEEQSVVSITNGYDDEDFQATHPSPADRTIFRIVHNGTMHTEMGLRLRRRAIEHALLGRKIRGMDPLTRSHVFLLNAIHNLRRRRSEIAETIRLTLVGPITKADREAIERSGVADLVETPGYLDHVESLQKLLDADLLFLPMHNLPNHRRSTVIPGKLYEYMASGKPILGAVPQGDARDFLSSCGTAFLCIPDDVHEMERIIEHRVLAWRNQERPPASNRDFVRRFERKSLTADLAKLVFKVCSSPRAPRHCGLEQA